MFFEDLAPGRLPPGLRVYAIGDVHGCADRLVALYAAIDADLAARPSPSEALLLHLGDYVDRGPDSAGVLEALLNPSGLAGAGAIHLLGNHEAMMLEACAARAPPDALAFWMANGGLATLESYGTDPHEPEWLARIPCAHLALLRNCPLQQRLGDYLFVHAGVRPDVPLDRQDPEDLLWIREPFLSWRGKLESVVVHGHTPMPVPTIRPHRIGIDTGACFGGDLTCLVLEEGRMGFLAV
jgi:serine/threonine protein phosphatase 1